MYSEQRSVEERSTVNQVFASLSAHSPARRVEPILCRYINTSDHIEVIKITSVQNCCFERTVFPGQQILFEASPEAQIEIFTGEIVQAIIRDKILCRSLCIQPDIQFDRAYSKQQGELGYFGTRLTKIN